MSRENVERVRRWYSVPFGGDDWFAWGDEFVAPDFELEDRTLPDVSAGLRGADARDAEVAYMSDAFEDIRYEVEEVIDLEDGRVLVRTRGSARGRGSGMQIDGILGHLWTWSEGKVQRLDVYGSWDEALEAAGLSE